MDNETRQKAVDSLLNFETVYIEIPTLYAFLIQKIKVKYYNAEAYEVDRFRKSFEGFQARMKSKIK